MEAPASIDLYAQAPSVQELIENGISEVPQAYIQPQPIDYSLENAKELLQIPVIDLSSGNVQEIVRQVGDACENWGFFQVVNHGIAELVLENMLQAAQDFFDLPMENKMEYFSATLVPRTTRYSIRFDNASVVDWRDFLSQGVCYPLSEEVIQTWPDKPPDYRNASTSFCKEMHTLASKMLELISQSLGLSPSRLEEGSGGLVHTMLINRYLPCPQPELVLALRNHSDPNTVTLLVQNEVSGLQVLKDGKWITIHGLPNSIIVNLGDQIEIMSNGKYKSVEHRALANSKTTRLSIASFFQPPDEALVGPLPELIDEDHPAVFKWMSFYDYRRIFLARQAKSKTVIAQVKITT